jgi:hypothetical protein
VGDLAGVDNRLFVELVVISRLSWVLLWVRGELLLWDYANEEVVHWLAIDDETDMLCGFFVDNPDYNSALYLLRDPTLGFVVINLQALTPRGGKTSVTQFFQKLGDKLVPQSTSLMLSVDSLIPRWG